jgi:muramoyltetrapeptide carboxypeptidase
MQFIVPKAIGPGSHLRLVAPSSPFDRTLFLRGLAWLKERYRVTFDRGVFARDGFLAGSDERRQLELDQALRDPSVEAIVAVRGGHGLLRLVDQVCWSTLRDSPKWLVGFSDITALHGEAWHLGVASLHAAMVGGLGRGDAEAREQWISALEEPNTPRLLKGEGVVRGSAKGPLVGGNLTVLTMLAAAGRLRLPAGCILALEDVSESSYSVDRMLVSLGLGGYLEQVSGFAVGEFLDCGAGQFNVPVKSVLLERLAKDKPVVLGLPFGHGRNVCPLTLGANACLNGDTGTLVVAAG